MRVIKCDVCGKELTNQHGFINIPVDFIYDERFVDLCEECYKAYKDIETLYLKEKDKIYEKHQKDYNDLREKYKKEMLKLREKE